MTTVVTGAAQLGGEAGPSFQDSGAFRGAVAQALALAVPPLCGWRPRQVSAPGDWALQPFSGLQAIPQQALGPGPSVLFLLLTFVKSTF